MLLLTRLAREIGSGTSRRCGAERRRKLLLPLALLALALVTPAGASSFEGLAQNMILLTDALEPPAIRALSTKTLEMQTLIEYTREDLAVLGVPLDRGDGQNRTLRPSGIALLEGAYSDTVYWTDAGAGAVLGLRFDSTGLRVLARGLTRPEALLIDASAQIYRAVQSKALYWGDSGSNRIQRCLVDEDKNGGAGNCSRGVTDVLTGVSQVAGLAHDPLSGRLFWADGAQLRVFSAPVDPTTGVATASGKQLIELVSYVAMPTGLALEPASSFSRNSRRLYVLDQAKPTALLRVWLNGNGTQTLVPYGLSQPRAIGLAKDRNFFCIADSGTQQLLLGTTGADTPLLREAYASGDVPFEPRGVAIRSDAEILISLGNDADGTAAGETLAGGDAESAGAPARHAHAGGRAGASALALAAGVLVLAQRGRAQWT